MNSDVTELGHLILGMRKAYSRGENAMEYARNYTLAEDNILVSTLIAYDLQAGTYVENAKSYPEKWLRWSKQFAEILDPYIDKQSSILEVGCGEATTLTGISKHLNNVPKYTLGFDISWSRCSVGMDFLLEKDTSAKLFVADLFDIPLEDESVDVVYTSHSLEPNGGREEDALRELLRVARRAVVLVEPIFELANIEAQARMSAHGYVKGLKETALRLGAKISDYRLLDYSTNKLNPSGLVLIEKEISEVAGTEPSWRCPLTHTPISELEDVFAAIQSGLVYPVLRGIPMLRAEHAIVASKYIE